MPRWIALALGFAFPCLFWVCYWQSWPFWLCGLLLLPLAWPTKAAKNVFPPRIQSLMGLAAAFLGGVALLWQNDLSLLFYPVFVNLTLLGVFALSLTQRQSLVERLARLSHPDLPPAGVRYTRRVTQAWCVFFVLNASLALWSVGAGKTVWAVYNGGIAYGLIGLMFTGEWFIRRYRIGRDTNE